MKLSVNDLRSVLKVAIREAKKKTNKGKFDPKTMGINGRDGYESEDNEQPRGFKRTEAHDFSKQTQETPLYKRQGQANFGPYTAESMVRAIARDMTVKEVKMPKKNKLKKKVSAPFNETAPTGKSGGVGNVDMPEWNGPKAKKKDPWYSAKKMKESFNNVYGMRINEVDSDRLSQIKARHAVAKKDSGNDRDPSIKMSWDEMEDQDYKYLDKLAKTNKMSIEDSLDPFASVLGSHLAEKVVAKKKGKNLGFKGLANKLAGKKGSKDKAKLDKKKGKKVAGRK